MSSQPASRSSTRNSTLEVQLLDENEFRFSTPAKTRSRLTPTPSASMLPMHNFCVEAEMRNTLYRKGSLVHSEIVRFDMSTFLREFFIQFFWPLNFPFVYRMEGFYGMHNRQLINGYYAVFQFLFFPLNVVAALLFIYRREDYPDLFALEIIFPNALLLLRAIILAVKYAIMPFTYLELLRTRVVTSDLTHRQQLISGWTCPDIVTVERELDTAAARLNIDLDSLYFYACNESLIRPLLRRLAAETQKWKALRGYSKAERNVSPEYRQLIEDAGDSGLWVHYSGGTAPGPDLDNYLGGQILGQVPQQSPEVRDDVCYLPTKGSENKGDDEVDAAYTAPDGEKGGKAGKGVMVGVEATSLSGERRPLGCISAKQFLASILLNSNIPGVRADRLYRMAYGFAFLCSLMPGVGRVSQGMKFFGETPWEMALIPVLMFLAVNFLGIIMGFIVVGVLDYYRRYTALRMLTYSIASGHHTNVDLRQTITSGQGSRGMINLRVAENIHTYSLIRKVLLEFGMRFHWRIQLYCSSAAAFSLVGLVAILIGMVQKRQFITTAFTLSSVCWILIQGLVMLAIIYLGGLCNEQYLHDKGWLQRERLDVVWDLTKIMQKDREPTSIRVQELRTCDMLLSRATALLVTDAQTSPIKFLGFTCSSTLTKSVIVALISAVSMFLNLFVSNEYDL